LPFCRHCGWQYRGQPRFCRECGRPILRRAGGVRPNLRLVPQESVEPLTRPLWRDRVLVVALAVLACVGFLLAGAAANGAALGGLPSDEAWVRLVYARNLAQTAHLEFNTGQHEAGLGSVLWVLGMALQIKTLGGLGLNVIWLAKISSLAATAASALLGAEVARRVTGDRVAALTAGALIALDATFAYAGISGVETTLLAALALATCVAVLDRRPIATGVLLALAVLTSLEGLVLVPLVAMAVGAPLVPTLRRGARPTRQELMDLAAAVAPGLVAALVWLWLDAPPSGALPAELYAARTARGGAPVPDLVALWRGYVEPAVGVLGGGAWLAGGPAIVVGAWTAARRRGWLAAPLVGFAPCVTLGVTATLPLTREPWAFALRRELDAVLPYVAVLAVVGVWGLWRLLVPLGARRYAPGPARRPAWAVAAIGVPILAAVLPLAGTASLWGRLPREYANAAVTANDTYFALARYVRDNVPEQALVAAIEPGAIRYVSRRPVADLAGVHTPALAGRPPVEALAEARAEFAALPLTRLWDSAPGTSLVREFSAPGDDPNAQRLGLFRTALGVAGSPRDNVYAFPSERLNKLDFVDVGNETSEREHAYTVVEARETIRRTSKVTEDRVVVEEGRAWANAEAVSLRAEPGRDLLVARRFDGFAPGGFRVTVDGQPTGEWWPRAGSYALAEDSFRIPGRLIRSQRVVVRLELIPESAPETATFAYWSFSDQ
jgi:hypothetical protein